MSEAVRHKRQFKNKSVTIAFTEIEYLAISSYLQTLPHPVKLPEYIRKLTVGQVLGNLKKKQDSA